MHSKSTLQDFIAHARSKGMDHQTIRTLLLSNGWKEKDIADALATESLTMAIPVPPDAGSARDAFFHLLSFTALITTIVSLIILFFTFLERLFPDSAFPTYDYSPDALASTLRWPLASVIVAFPLFLWMSWILYKEYQKHPEKLGSGVRRWLTYLTLFLTACTLLGDAITLVSYFLQGELTVRFLLKCFTIFVLTGLPFWYYLNALRMSPEEYSGSPLHKLFLLLSSAIVLIAIVWSFLLMGGPGLSRQYRFDEERLNDLRAIHAEILNIAYDGNMARPMPIPPNTRPTKPLPKTLQEVSDNAVYQKIDVNDPETKALYEYHVLSSTRYELCAVFSTARDLEYDIAWNHPAGRHCFQRDALKLEVR